MLKQKIKNLKSKFRKKSPEYESSQFEKYMFPTDIFTDNQKLMEERYLKAEDFSQHIKKDLEQILSSLFKNIVFIDKVINSRNLIYKYKFKADKNVIDAGALEYKLTEALSIQRIWVVMYDDILEISLPYTDFDKDEGFNTFAIPINNKKVLENVNLENPTEYIMGISQENEVIKGNLDSNQKSMLLTGNTGEGKTNWFHQILITMMAHNTPDDIKMAIIDLKRSPDYLMYNDLPYMLENPIFDIEFAESFFDFISKEIYQRKELFIENEVQDIDEYNSRKDIIKINKLPRWIIFVDEYNVFNEDNTSINALIELLKKIHDSEGVGIHLFISQSKVSKTNLLGENHIYIDKRATLKLPNSISSEIAIGKSSAENLLNRGDMLVEITDNLKRIQNLYISEDEIWKITNYLKEKYND